MAKLVNVTNAVREAEFRIQGVGAVLPEASLMVLSSDSPRDENGFGQPDKVSPREQTFAGAGRTFTYPVPPFSVVIMRIKVAGNVGVC